MIVDSSEWDELRYEELAERFERTAVSDIAWARTDAWRIALAGLLAGDRASRRSRSAGRGPRRRCCAAGSPRGSTARSARVEPAGELGVRLDGEELPPPRDDAAHAERPAERRARQVRAATRSTRRRSAQPRGA